MAYLEIDSSNENLKVNAEFGSFEMPNSQSNKKACMIMLRSLKEPQSDTPLFTYQNIADAFGYPDRRNVHNYWSEFESCGGDLLNFLNRKRKVDTTVINAVGAVVSKKPIASLSEICDEVNNLLGRSDLTNANVQTALEQTSCIYIRKELKRCWELGEFHPKEDILLEELMMSAAKDFADENEQKCSPLLRSLEIAPADAEKDKLQGGIQENQLEAATDLLNPNKSPDEISRPIRLMIFAIALYYWNVPLSRIGMWLGVSKSTVYNWITGLAMALWPLIESAIRERVKGAKLYVDEKWIKIKGKWHFWFVAVDAESGIPILGLLLPSQNQWACRWFMVKLKRYGICPNVVITDGLLGYASAIAIVFTNAKHLLCLFHHQQGVTRLIAKYFKNADDAGEIKRKMKKVVQAKDGRTVKRRLDRLKKEAGKKGWDIDRWIKRTQDNLVRLLPALRKNCYPKTTNEIERFFRVFQRFYKTRGGFHSVLSAKRGLLLFLIGYLFTRQVETGKAPIENIIPEAKYTPLYQILNNPLRWGMLELGLNMSRKGG